MRCATALVVPVRTLSWFVFSHFEAVHHYSVHCSRRSQKITNTLYFGGSRSFKVIEVDTPKKLFTSACYDKQHVCAYLQQFSR